MRVTEERASKIVASVANNLSKDPSYCTMVQTKRNQAFAITCNLTVTDKESGEFISLATAIGEDNVGLILNTVEECRLQRVVGNIKVSLDPEPEKEPEA